MHGWGGLMTKGAVLFSITACSALLAFALFVAGFSYPAALTALLGAVWLVLYLRKSTRFNGLVFVLFGLISAGSAWAGVSEWYALAGLSFALFAWDLTSFEDSLRGLLEPGDVRTMELAHFSRFGLVFVLGITGVIASKVITIELTLGSALIFSLAAIWGLSALVYRVRGGG